MKYALLMRSLARYSLPARELPSRLRRELDGGVDQLVATICSQLGHTRASTGLSNSAKLLLSITDGLRMISSLIGCLRRWRIAIVVPMQDCMKGSAWPLDNSLPALIASTASLVPLIPTTTAL